MSISRDKITQIIRNHGLYCIPLASSVIGLTDDKGNVYDTIIWDGSEVIEDENTSMSLAAWLGY